MFSFSDPDSGYLPAGRDFVPTDKDNGPNSRRAFLEDMTMGERTDRVFYKSDGTRLGLYLFPHVGSFYFTGNKYTPYRVLRGEALWTWPYKVGVDEPIYYLDETSDYSSGGKRSKRRKCTCRRKRRKCTRRRRRR